MTREEAIEVVRRCCPRISDSKCDFETAMRVLVPELTESEDERIRKVLVKMAKVPRKEIYEVEGITKEQALAWLEKQKINTDGDFARGYDCGYQCCLNSHGAEWFEKQKEQKPAEWSERDKEYLNQAIETLEHEGYEILATALKSINPQPKAEWSEEDEKIRRNLMSLLSCMRGDRITEETYQKYYPWLKSLRPQIIDSVPLYTIEQVDEKVREAQEWSEEDEKMLKSIIEDYEKANEDCFKLQKSIPFGAKISWLKSLRPPLKDKEMKLKILKYLSTRCSSLEFEEVEDYLNNLRPSWKPSEEQMDALGTVTFGLIGTSTRTDPILESLYNDLKKLCPQSLWKSSKG